MVIGRAQNQVALIISMNFSILSLITRINGVALQIQQNNGIWMNIGFVSKWFFRYVWQNRMGMGPFINIIKQTTNRYVKNETVCVQNIKFSFVPLVKIPFVLY